MSFEYDAEVPCSNCGGDGGWDAPTGHYNHYDGSLITTWVECPSCSGSGDVTVHMRPIDFEDLAEIPDDDDAYSAFAYRGGNP